jgi:hypothetical protein
MNTYGLLKKDMEKILLDMDEETVVLSKLLGAIPTQWHVGGAWGDHEKTNRLRRLERVLKYVAARNGMAL